MKPVKQNKVNDQWNGMGKEHILGGTNMNAQVGGHGMDEKGLWNWKTCKKRDHIGICNQYKTLDDIKWKYDVQGNCFRFYDQK